TSVTFVPLARPRSSFRDRFGIIVLGLVQLQRELKIGRFIAREFDRIYARIARGAVRALLTLDRAQHPFEAQVRDAVGFQKLADLLERVRRADQLRLARRVDAVEAGRDGRRAADTNVHFLGPRGAHHADDLTAGRAPHNRVVHENDAL